MRLTWDIRHLPAAVAALALGVLAAAGAQAQLGPGPFAVFPTADPTDARMLSFGCSGIATFEQQLNITLDSPASNPSFTLSIFDGDTGGNWDAGTRQLVYRLYADPLQAGSESPAALIGAWLGNAANPTSGPGWTTSAATMPNNAWWGLTVANTPAAQAPSGNYFYNLVISTDGACAPLEALVSDFKLASDTPMTFGVPRFGFEASLRNVALDGPIVYPGPSFPPPGGFLSAPTTFDGTFEFFLNVSRNSTELRLFDGDFDHGTGGLTALPSGVTLAPCADADDPDTPATYSSFPFAPVGAVPEGANSPGSPSDDTILDLFRRGEPGDPDRIGCVRYEVIAPDGTVFRNDNPSGNLEWEQFRVVGQLATDPGDSDYQVAEDFLEAGIWSVRIVGLDLSNLNFWVADACAMVDGLPACPSEAVYLVGDTVWLDLDQDGFLDPGESGIPGVVVHLFSDLSQPPIKTVTTGDASMPDWENCLAHNTGNDTAGLYCFGVPDPGTYVVVVAAENFEPGGALEGKSSTTGGESQSDVVVATNVLTYDFGYADCGPCEGKVSRLTFQYLGGAPATIAVVGRRGKIKADPLFEGPVAPGGTFEVVGPPTGPGGFQGTLGTEITVFVNDAFHAMIHTSCSQPIGPGMVFGDLLVVAGASKHGGPLCPL